MITKKYLLSLITISISMMANLYASSDECSPAALRVVEEKNFSIAKCVQYTQPLEKQTYLAVLETYTHSDGSDQSRIRHFIQEGNSFNVVFSINDLGEAFLPVIVGEDTSLIQVFDTNNDGQFEVIFRSYIVPTALLTIHQFNKNSQKIEVLGMIDTGFEVAEFYPFIVTSTNDNVTLNKGKISLENSNNGSRHYIWKKNAFYLND